MKVIICGAGQVGYQIAKYLAHENMDVTLIDLQSQLVEKALDTLDVKGVVGFASHPPVLEKAGAGDADMLIAVTQSDEVNMIACQVAFSLFNVPTTIARIRHQSYLDPSWSSLFSSGGLRVDLSISPEVEVAKAAFRRLEFFGTTEVMQLVQDRVTVVGVRCREDCPILRTPLTHLSKLFPDLNVVIIAILRNEKLIRPSGSTQLLEGDEVFCVVETTHLDRMMIAFGYEKRKLSKIAIVGGGNIGLYLAEMLEENLPYIQKKIIEINPERARLIAQTLTGSLVLEGDILDSEILNEADVAGLDSVVAVTSDDEVNILSSLLAKRYGCPKVMTLINTSAYQPLLPALGIDVVINPRAITVSSILHYLRKGRIRSAFTLREGLGEIIEAEAVESSPIVGKPVMELNLPKGVMIGAILRKDEFISPRGDSIVLAGDRVILFSPLECVRKLEKLFTVRIEFF